MQTDSYVVVSLDSSFTRTVVSLLSEVEDREARTRRRRSSPLAPSRVARERTNERPSTCMILGARVVVFHIGLIGED